MSNPEPDYALTELYLYLTSNCNLRCRHCWIEPGFSQEKQGSIPLDALKKVISDAKPLGLQRVKLTGGEPLLYKEIQSLIMFLTDEELSISMETNGSLINKDTVSFLTSGTVNHIAVSLDAATEEIHDDIRGVKGSFNKTVKGVRLLSSSGINTQIIMTLQRKNMNDIHGLIRLCEDLGVNSLKINPMNPCGRAMDEFEKGQNLSLTELTSLYKTIEEAWPQKDTVSIIFDLPLAFLSIEDIKQYVNNRCRILNILGILANGDFSICGIGEIIDALRMGNIFDVPIQDVWQNNAILNDLRQSLPGKLKGVCGDCIFKFQCLGACRANAYAVEKDLYAPYFLCKELYESGQFPKSRVV